jgi:hypothetical protein
VIIIPQKVEDYDKMGVIAPPIAMEDYGLQKNESISSSTYY